MTTPTLDFISALITASDLRSAGEDSRAYRRDVERGRLVRVRRGVYLPNEIWAALDPRDRWVARMWAFQLTAERVYVFSHESAARLHGLPLLPDADKRLSIAVSQQEGARADGDLRRRPLQLAPKDIELVRGLLVTSVARTVVDLAGALSFPAGVIVADAGLRNGTTSRDDYEQASQAAALQRVSRKVRRVIDFADALADSPGESLSRAVIHEAGFPAPLLQQSFRDERGLIGVVDFWWPDHRLIGEFDGRIKYQSGRFEGTPDDRLWKEKLREDRLRAQHTAIARWIWSDAMAPALLAYELTRHGLPTTQVHRGRPSR